MTVDKGDESGYPWSSFGVDHEDLHFTTAGQVFTAMGDPNVVREKLAAAAALLGPDPETAVERASARVKTVKDKVKAGQLPETLLAPMEANAARIAKLVGCWQFWVWVLVEIGG